MFLMWTGVEELLALFLGEKPGWFGVIDFQAGNTLGWINLQITPLDSHVEYHPQRIKLKVNCMVTGSCSGVVRTVRLILAGFTVTVYQTSLAIDLVAIDQLWSYLRKKRFARMFIQKRHEVIYNSPVPGGRGTTMLGVGVFKETFHQLVDSNVVLGEAKLVFDDADFGIFEGQFS